MEKVLNNNNNVDNLDALLLHILTDVAEGKISIVDAHSGLAELIHLIDNRNPNAESWLKEGRKNFYN